MGSLIRFRPNRHAGRPWHLLLLAAPLWSNSPTDSLCLSDLLDLKVVTATLTDQEIRKAPSTIYSYSGSDLRRWGIRSIGELMARVVPGVILVEDGDETIAAFRGVATDNNTKVLTLVNGHPINPKWAKGATPELELGLMEDIDRVEVIVGPGSAIYGSGATIGVINIITKRPPRQTVQGSATAILGSGPYGLADASISGQNGSFGFTSSAGGLRSEGFPRRDGSHDENAPLFIDGHPVNGRVFSQIELGEDMIQARYTTQSRNLYNNTTNAPQQATGAAEYEVWNYAFVEATHHERLSDQLDLRFILGADAHETKRFDYVHGWQTRAIGERHWSAFTRAGWKPSDQLDFQGGVKYEYDDFGDDFSGLNFQAAAKLDPTTGKTSGLDISDRYRMVTPYSRNNFGSFGQAIYQINETFTILAGLRFDYIESDVLAQEMAFTPRVGLVVSPDEKTTLKALFSTGFRPPMAILTSPDGYMLGNSAYHSTIDAPEKARSFELSAERTLHPNVHASLSGFYNRFQDIHSLRANPDGSLEFLSGGEVDYFGGEASALLFLPMHLQARVTHQIARPGFSRDDPGHVLLSPDNEHLVFYPEHSTKALVDIPLASFLSVNFNSLLIWNNYGYEGVYGQDSSIRETGAYAVLNGNVVVDLGPRGELVVGGRNLLDTNPKIPFSGTIGRPVSRTRIAGFHWDASYHREF